MLFAKKMFMLMNTEGGEAGSGGASDAMKAELDKAKKEIQAMKSQLGRMNQGKENKNESLYEKNQARRVVDKETQSNSSELEKALSFTLKANDFYSSNKDLIPSDVAEMIEMASKENYDSAITKASAIKSGIIESFFSVESNLGLLTTSQKKELEDFRKLTKNGRESKASKVYEFVLEPALEIVKRVKKAEELAKSRNGFSSSNSVTDDYKQRLINGAKKRHLNNKGD